MVTGIGQKHKVFVDINVKNNLQCLCVDKSFDLSYLMTESDIELLKAQKFEQLNIRAAISFGSDVKYELDIDKPIIDQLKSIAKINLSDYFCEMHLLINEYAPMKELDSVSQEIAYRHLDYKSSAKEVIVINSDKLKATDEYNKDIDEIANDRANNEEDSAWFPDDKPSKSDVSGSLIEQLLKLLKKKQAIIRKCTIVICILTLVVFVIIVSYINRRGRIINEFQQCLIEKNYESAVSIYNENIIKNSKTQEEANSIIKKSIEEISVSCQNNELGYDDALKALSCLEAIQNPDIVIIAKDNISKVLILNLKDYITQGDYNNTVKLYNEQAKTYSDFAKESKRLFEESIDNISTSCFDGKTPCYQAISRLAVLKGVHDSTLISEIENAIQKVTEFEQEKEIIHLAETHLEHGSFHSALKYSHEIPDSSRLYQAAEDCYNEAKEALLVSLSNPHSKEDYEKYINMLTKYIEDFPDEKDFEDKKKALENELKEVETTEEIAQIISSAKEKKEGGDLISALDIIINARKTYGSDNTSLNQAYDEYHTEYISTVKKEIDTAINSSGYSQAQDIINNALIQYPNDAELKELQASIDDYKPTPLNTMNLINSDGWNWNDGVAEDPFQNPYSDACNYIILSSGNWGKSGSVEYRINKQYSNLVGRITPQKDMGENGSGYIQVYGDGVLRYTSPLIKQKTDVFEFSADMKAVEYIKIEIHIDSHSAILLSDLQLTPSWGDNSGNMEYTPITSLTVLNESDWQWENTSARDLFETDYTHVCNYTVLSSGNWGKGAYVEYRIKQEYSKISGKIAPGVEMGENGSGYVEIYSGDNLLYKSDNVGDKTTPFEFEQDISGIEYLKINIYVDGHSSIILSDVKLWP